MKLQKLDLKKFFSDKGRTHKAHHIKFIQPQREWFLGLLLGLIVFCAGATYAYIVFFNSLESSTGEGVLSGEVSRVVYDEAKVAQVLTEYRARAERFTALQNAIPASSTLPLPVSTTTIEVENNESTENMLQTGGIRVQ
jgi:hypothetical protein